MKGDIEKNTKSADELRVNLLSQLDHVKKASKRDTNDMKVDVAKRNANLYTQIIVPIGEQDYQVLMGGADPGSPVDVDSPGSKQSTGVNKPKISVMDQVMKNRQMPLKEWTMAKMALIDR